MKSKKIQFVFNGMTFEIESSALRTKSWGGEDCKPFIYLTQKHVASIIKQYVKALYPKVEVWAKSQSYSGGDSVDIYLSYANGDKVEVEIEKDIDKFTQYFEEGKFNGMCDMYEYSDTKLATDNGTELRGGTKYAFVRNGAPFGSVPDVVRMLKDLMAGQYIYGVLSLDKAIEKVKGYKISDTTINKALNYI